VSRVRAEWEIVLGPFVDLGRGCTMFGEPIIDASRDELFGMLGFMQHEHELRMQMAREERCLLHRDDARKDKQ
jgi:hypothetical protein